MKTLLLTFATAMPFWSLAASAQQLTDAQVRAATQAAISLIDLQAFVDANNSFCRRAAPQTADAVKRATDQWHAVNGTQFLWPVLGEDNDDLALSLAAMTAARQTEIETLLVGRSAGREAEWCANIPMLLTDAKWDLHQNFPQEIDAVRALNAMLLDEEVSPLEPGQLLPEIPAVTLSEAEAAGYEPGKYPLPGEYRCYDQEATTVDHADLIVQITGPGSYTSSFGPGFWVMTDDIFEWATGPFADASTYMQFDEHGASFPINGVMRNGVWSSYECKQAGAADAALATAVRLVTPQIGDYACTDVATGAATPFSILPGNEYKFGSETGTYTLGDVVNSTSSNVNWRSGPFANVTSYYSEEEGNGRRQFSINTNDGRAIGGFVYSSNELSMVCEGLGTAVHYDLYGADPAPPVQPGTQVLDGTFTRDEDVFNGTFSRTLPQVYTFHPDGYVYIGVPDPGVANDCTRTLPNGRAACSRYQILGNQMVITTDGEAETYKFTMQNGLPMMDDAALSPVQPATITALNGHYWANYYYGFGICGAFSSCSSTYIEWNYVFSPDGRFTYTSDSQSLSSMDTAIASSNISSSSSDADQGSYMIEGNTITFTFDNGVVQPWFFWQGPDDTFMISEELYSAKEDP